MWKLKNNMSESLSVHNLKNLVKQKARFENPVKTSCIDVILANSPGNFQNSSLFETGTVISTNLKGNYQVVNKWHRFNKRFHTIQQKMHFYILLKKAKTDHLPNLDINSISDKEKSDPFSSKFKAKLTIKIVEHDIIIDDETEIVKLLNRLL